MTLHTDAPAAAQDLDSPDGGLSAAELAAKYGLSVSGARPGLGEYTRQLWGRRHFINEFAKARTQAQ
ncbi:ABC transporter permease, partial [Streptomyces fildesensis]|nr:ABC transporter permease [Streptomyces sp. H39-C1]